MSAQFCPLTTFLEADLGDNSVFTEAWMWVGDKSDPFGVAAWPTGWLVEAVTDRPSPNDDPNWALFVRDTRRPTSRSSEQLD